MKRQELSPEVEALWEQPLEPEEFERRLSAALADDDSIEEAAALVRWFLRRYPTAQERFAYARRTYAQQTRVPVSIAPVLPR